MKINPFTGNTIVLKHKKQIIKYKDRDICINYSYYQDESNGMNFTDDILDDKNMQKVIKKYQQEEILKKYIKYLIDYYSNIMVGDGGNVFRDLNQFYTEGVIKDLLDNKSSFKSKKNIVNIYQNRIYIFAYSKHYDVYLMKFEEFKKQESLT